MIELDVAPLRPVTITWNDVIERMPQELPTELSALLPNVPILRLLGSDQEVDPEAKLAPKLNCWVDLGHPHAFGLSVSLNEPMATDEALVIEDYGRNLNTEDQERIATAWQSVGYDYSLSSTGGRAKGDLDLMAALAITLAALTNGVVITEDNYGAMGTGVGVFSAEEFKDAMWGSK